MADNSESEEHLNPFCHCSIVNHDARCCDLLGSPPSSLRLLESGTGSVHRTRYERN
jgi:hypothetical protein